MKKDASRAKNRAATGGASRRRTKPSAPVQAKPVAPRRRVAVKKAQGNRAETVDGRRANALVVDAQIAQSRPAEDLPPMALILSPAERKALRAAAHPLQAVVMVGREGLNPSVLREAESAIRAHALIKVRLLGSDRAERQSILETLCEHLGCAPVQSIGKLLVLYRPQSSV